MARRGERRRAGTRANVFLATVATVVAVSPAFFVSAQAVEIDHSLRLTVADLGLAVAIFFGVTAASTAMLGRLVQRQGVRRGLMGTMTCTVLGLLCIAAAHSSAQLDAGLVVAGIGNGAVHPTANGLLAARQAGQPGRAFGLKQSAPTAASLVAGLVVPIIALTVGWQWSFVAMCVPGAAVAFLGRSVAAGNGRAAQPTTPHRVARRDADAPLVVIAVAAAFGSAAGNVLAAFFVLYGVHAEHIPPSTAALVFALASFCGVVGRVTTGRVVDRTRLAATSLAAGLAGMGVIGDLILASGSSAGVLTLLAGGVVAFGLGWSWPGLLHYSVAMRDPSRAPRATGILMTGFASGACLGPLILGELTKVIGYSGVWHAAAVLNLLAGAVLVVGTRLRRSVRVAAEAPPPA